MQAIDIKRFTVTRIGMAALAIGALSAAIIGYVALDDATSDSGVAAVSPNIERVPLADTIRFLELNTQLPAVMAAPRLRSEEMLFVEMNTLLPEVSSTLTRSAEEMLFLEMNTLLPTAPAPKVVSFAEMQFLELNTQLPGSDALIPPAPEESQPVGGDNRY